MDSVRITDPATGEAVGEVANHGLAECVEAARLAAAEFPRWRETPPRQRGEILRRAFEAMIASQDRLAELVVRENGKLLADARAEIAYAAEFFRWFSEEATRVEGGFRYSPARDKTIITDYRPIGVVFCITPWNFPAAMATRKLGPALAAGCTAILKPATETPLTALWVGDVLQRAGAPAGVVNVITTSKTSQVCEAILADPRIATLSFTGSTFVGKLLLRQTADRVLRSSMELGGNAPFLVLEGTDVEAAVAGAMVAKMRNGGAACTAANRFYVHESLAREFSDRLEAALGAIKIGPGVDASNDLGAMVSIKERDKILELIAAGEAEGATITRAVDTPEVGAFVAPHIVRDVEHGSVLTRNEIFGPVAPIITFTDQDDAIRMANDTEYGLISYVFAKDPGTGVRVARQMESGMVAINRGIASDPAAPFGGMKESGLGREGGFEGIKEFLEMQYFAVDL